MEILGRSEKVNDQGWEHGWRGLEAVAPGWKRVLNYDGQLSSSWTKGEGRRSENRFRQF